MGLSKVTIKDEQGREFTGYIDNGTASDSEIKKRQLREKLHIIYLSVAITAFSIAIYSQIKRLKAT